MCNKNVIYVVHLGGRKMCCSFYLPKPMTQSHPTGYSSPGGLLTRKVYIPLGWDRETSTLIPLPSQRRRIQPYGSTPLDSSIVTTSLGSHLMLSIVITLGCNLECELGLPTKVEGHQNKISQKCCNSLRKECGRDTFNSQFVRKPNTLGPRPKMIYHFIPKMIYHFIPAQAFQKMAELFVVEP